MDRLANWYGEALTIAYGQAPADGGLSRLRALLEQTRPGLIVVRADEQQPIGVVEYELANPKPGWCTFDFVAIEPQLRGWGYGSEAVRLAEQLVGEQGIARRFRALVAPSNGLNFYFWLRLGYRTARQEDRIDAFVDDALAMVRTQK